MSRFDIIIVGAGISGLVCAQKLVSAGKKVLVLEAKSKPGGRILTHSTSPYTIELGAEFIHGAPRSIIERLRDSNIPFYDVHEEHLYVGKKSRPIDFWERLNAISKKATRFKKDKSVVQFMDDLKLSGDIKEIFKGFVEGFHAADPTKMSAKALDASNPEMDRDLEGCETFRITQGYQALVSSIYNDIQSKCEIHFNAVVDKISWQKNSVTISSSIGEYSAACAVITLPIGVLKNPGSIQWSPYPENLIKSLEAFEMGHVVRMAFQFQSRFWESLSERRFSFMHTDAKTYFPTWWTSLPVRSPILIGWQGGPKAKELSKLSEDQRADFALNSLSKITRKSLRFLHSQLVARYHHDWSNDPYCQGAYSYVSVDGMKRSETLKHPIEDTLFFAGEACGPHSSQGTVHGAIFSGEYSARRILKV